jgi:hypothetical protein
MKAKMRLFVVVVMTVALLTALLPGTGLAQDNKTYFTGTSCWMALLDPGVWTPLGNGNFHITGLQIQFLDTTSDPRLTGDDFTVVNGIQNPVDDSGPLWGTFEVVNAVGSWSGQWVRKEENGGFTINGLLHGSGSYDGLVANWSYGPNYNQEGCALLSGYIVETGAGN